MANARDVGVASCKTAKATGSKLEGHMMTDKPTWRYRVVRDNTDYLTIHEVHTDPSVGMTVNPVCPGGHSLEELRGDIELMLRALGEEVLDD